MILILQVSYVTDQIWLAGQKLGFRNQKDKLMLPDGFCLISAGLSENETTL